MEKQMMSRMIMPGETNYRGILFGGNLLSWFDEVCGITARRFTGGNVTTAAVERVDFLKPITVGTIVDIKAEVISVGNTSMRVCAEAYAQPTPTAESVLAARTVYVFVSIDADGRPQKIGRTI